MAYDKRRKPWFKEGLDFECTQCGGCCTGSAGLVEITRAELLQMAEFLACQPEELQRRYLRRVDQGWAIQERERPETGEFDCLFLVREPGPSGTELTRCGIHPVRPQQCRTWPFWPSNLKSPRTWRKAGRACEGIGRGRRHSYQEIARLCQETPPSGRP